MLGAEGRERQLANMQETVRNMGRAGIPILHERRGPNGIELTLTRGPRITIPPSTAGRSVANLTPETIDRWAQQGWVDLRVVKEFQQTVLEVIKDSLRPGQRVFIGVTDVLSPRVESPEEVRDLILQASEYIPLAQLGTTDDCGFAPFADDSSTARETAFAKVRARVAGTQLAAEQLGV